MIGLDISENELRSAPVGCYDVIVVTDLCNSTGGGTGDVLIYQALLEHIPDVAHAIRACETFLIVLQRHPRTKPIDSRWGADITS